MTQLSPDDKDMVDVIVFGVPEEYANAMCFAYYEHLADLAVGYYTYLEDWLKECGQDALAIIMEGDDSNGIH